MIRAQGCFSFSPYCAIFFVILCFVFAPRTLFAVKSINSATAVPSLVFVGIPTQVRIEATLASDVNLLRNSITLVRLGPGDVSLSTAGLLVDDGTGGDSAANDNVFTIILPVTYNTPTKLRFRVSAAYKGSLLRVLSNPFIVIVDVPPSTSAIDFTKIVTDEHGTYPINEVLVSLKDVFLRADADSMASAIGGMIVGFDPSSNTYQIRVEDLSPSQLSALLSELRADPRVLAAARNQSFVPFVLQNDMTLLKAVNPSRIDAYDAIDAFAAWDILRNIALKPVRVGIIDAPVDRSHLEFSGVDFGDSPILAPTTESHGTAMAGIIGSNNASALGVFSSSQMNGILAGVPGPSAAGSALPYRLELRVTDYSSLHSVLVGISSLVASKVKVINMSFGHLRKGAVNSHQTQNCSENCKDAVIDDQDFMAYTQFYATQFTKHSGVVFVVAAGNCGIDVNDITPANLSWGSNVITVAATNQYDARACFSAFGTGVTISAPGEHVYKPINDNQYDLFSTGTSLSAPLVTGAAGLLLAAQNTLAPVQIKGILRSQADYISTDEPIGGRLNIWRAVEQVIPPLLPNQLPTAGFLMSSGTQSAFNGQTLNLTVPANGNANVSFDSSAPTYSFDPDGSVVSWQWSVGGALVFTSPTFSQSFAPGTYQISLFVTDSNGVFSPAATGTVVVTETVPNIVNISNNLGNAKRPAVDVDAQGIVHVAWWEDTGLILYTQSADNGATFLPPIKANGSVTVSNEPQSLSVASDAEGNVYLAWEQFGRVLLTTSRDGGTSFGSPDWVPQDAGLTQYGAGGPVALAAKPNGLVFVARTAVDLTTSLPGCPQNYHQSGILFSRSLNYGVSFFSATYVSSLTGAMAANPSMVVDSQGRIFIAYSQTTFTANCAAYSPKVTLVKSENDGVSFSLLSFSRYEIASSTYGGPKLSADSLGDIFVQSGTSFTSSSDGGLTFAPWRSPLLRFCDSCELPPNADNIAHVSSSVSANGLTILFLMPLGLSYPNAPENLEIYYFSSADGGLTFSKPTNISDDSGQSGNNAVFVLAGSAIAALKSGGAIAVWHDDTPGNFQIFCRILR